MASLPNNEEANASWSPDGNHLVFECYVDGPTRNIAENIKRHYVQEAADICITSRDGHNWVYLTHEPGADRYPTWSPNGTQIAYMRRDGVYVIDVDGSNHRRLVKTSQEEFREEVGKVHWSPDGTEILFSACLNGNLNRDIYVVNVSTGDLTNLTPNSLLQEIDPYWTLNGTKVVFSSTASTLAENSCSLNYDAPLQLKVINADGGRQEKVIYDQGNFYTVFSVLNNGKVAFVSDLVSRSNWESGMSERDSYIYTIDLENGIPVQRVKGTNPASWSPDGKYLLYSGVAVLEVETGQIARLPSSMPVIANIDGWSSDSQEIALTTFTDKTGFYSEKHIYIFSLIDGSVHQLIR